MAKKKDVGTLVLAIIGELQAGMHLCVSDTHASVESVDNGVCVRVYGNSVSDSLGKILAEISQDGFAWS